MSLQHVIRFAKQPTKIGIPFLTLMSFQLFYAPQSSQIDCVNLCQRNADCQGYKYDVSNNCWLYYLVGSDSGATIIGNRISAIPKKQNYQLSADNCISNTCQVLQTADLYDFNACLKLCDKDANCLGLGVDNQQRCSMIRNGDFNTAIQMTRFTGYTFIKQKEVKNSTASAGIGTVPLIIIIVAGIIALFLIVLAISKQCHEPEKKKQSAKLMSEFHDPKPFQNAANYSNLNELFLPHRPSNLEEPMLPHPSGKTSYHSFNEPPYASMPYAPYRPHPGGRPTSYQNLNESPYPEPYEPHRPARPTS